MVAFSELPELELIDGPVEDDASLYRSTTARQFSLWPFGTRSLRLFVLLDPSRVDPELQDSLLRAMQATCFGSEASSMTSAVRCSALAAHYVLQAHNRTALPHTQVTAAVAVALMRDNIAYVALVGEAAAFAWHGARLWGQRNGVRLGRPLGLEQEPRVTLWSTPVKPGDRLVLVCGGAWHAGTADTIREELSGHPTDVAQRRLAAILSTPRSPARVLVDDGTTSARTAPMPRRRAISPTRLAAPAAWRKWLASLLPLLLLFFVLGSAVAILRPGGEAPLPAKASAAQAREDTLDRTYAVQPVMAVRFGPSGANVVDLAVARDRLYTLDVQDGAVRGFDAQAFEQWPTPETVLVRKGAQLGGRALDTPVAIQYLPGAGSDPGALTIVDRARNVVQLQADGVLAPRKLASSAAWQQLGALSTDQQGNLYVLDSGAGRLLEYPQRLVDPPSQLLGTPGASWFSLDRVAEILALQDLYVRLENGSVRRMARDGEPLDFAVSTTDDPLGPVVGMAADRTGGLYLADPTHSRIVHTTADGAFIRQLRDPALAGVRQIQTSPDGQRLFGLVATGVLSFAIPSPS
jgi:hypothetical protein